MSIVGAFITGSVLFGSKKKPGPAITMVQSVKKLGATKASPERVRKSNEQKVAKMYAGASKRMFFRK